MRRRTFFSSTPLPVFFAAVFATAPLVGCDGSSSGNGGNAGSGGTGGSGASSGTAGTIAGSGGGIPIPTSPSCAADGGTANVQKPELLYQLADRWHEGWLASPAVVDLDLDGKNEVLVAREEKLLCFNSTGALVWGYDVGGRVWSSPVVADFQGDNKLEVAFASRGEIHMVNAAGQSASGFPVSWEDEMRSLAAGDVDGDGALDLVSTPGHSGVTDVMNAWHADGSPLSAFPPVEKGVSGCEVDQKCYLAGCYDQNVALGDLNGDGKQDLVVPHDNAYISIHQGTGEAFDANPMFKPAKTPGVRYLHDLDLAIQGYADDEESALQAHFTNTAPAIADIDNDGVYDVVFTGSVQNASQTDRFKGVGLWAVHSDAGRVPGWEVPYHAPDYVAGLWDPGGNIVGITNQVTVADINAESPGLEMVFVGFDARIHAVTADNKGLWEVGYAESDDVFSAGVAVGDLSADGIPEIVFATYSTAELKSSLFILDAGGNQLYKEPLPHRGSMAVPTLGDVDGDGTVDIVVSLKDADDKVELARVYRMPGSKTNCLLWPTGRANYLRNGWVPSKTN
ncbi:MAG: VCBS repeat-containing protein [Polyangiaceae bacterium]|nr:VCBS repeat-containing protein [Polyangiaceae bacterium]